MSDGFVEIVVKYADGRVERGRREFDGGRPYLGAFMESVLVVADRLCPKCGHRLVIDDIAGPWPCPECDCGHGTAA